MGCLTTLYPLYNFESERFPHFLDNWPRRPHFYFPGRFSTLIFVRGWADPKDIVRKEGCQLKVTPLGMEPATCRLKKYCLNRLYWIRVIRWRVTYCIVATTYEYRAVVLIPIYASWFVRTCIEQMQWTVRLHVVLSAFLCNFSQEAGKIHIIF